MDSGRLGNAAWIPPATFAERCPYEDGTFWIGRSPETGEALGYIDDRHIFLASGNRAGKGTTTILNNLCVWPGSVVVVDPKGENATVTAARRGKGSEYCEGMGQDVHVLDPFGASFVPDEYRSCYNPLDEINPNDPKVLRLTSKIADAIVVEQQGVKEPFWKDSARKMVKGIILHVLTSPRYDGRRNLVTVRNLINRGDIEGVEQLRSAGKTGVPSGHSMLWEGMSVNETVNGVIAGIGEQMAQLMQADAKLFHSMLQSVDRETEWLDDELIQKSLSKSDFTLADLKRNPNGLSVYLCMPEGDMTEYNRWIRMMLTLVIRVVEHQRERPACGHRILMVMDEFLALDRIKAVERAASYIAGFHLTMLFVVQGLSPLQEIYGKGWENIVGNCGLKIFFAVDEPFAREYFSKMIGDTEIRPDIHTHGSGTSTNSARSRSISESDTDGESTSRAMGTTRSKSTTDSTSQTNSTTDTESQSRGISASRSRNRSRSDSVNESTADTLGSSQARNRTNTLGWNDSTTDGTNWNKNKSHTDGEGSSEGGSWSPRKLLFRHTDDWTHWLRQNETKNGNTNRSSSNTSGSGDGGSHSKTSGKSGSSSEGLTDSQSQSQTNTLGHSQSNTQGEGDSLSVTQNDSTSRAVGVSDTTGQSKTESETKSITDTVSSTKSHTKGVTDGTTDSRGENKNQSVSESVHARRLVPAEDIGRLFDRPAPGKIGFALVILGGGHPTVVVRAPYYSDPFFGWLYDPHPDHEKPLKLMGNEKFALPIGGGSAPLLGQVELLKIPGDIVKRGDLIAELAEPVSDIDEISELFAGYAPRVDPGDFGFPDPVPADVRLPVYAQIEGKVVGLVRKPRNWHQEGDNFVILEVNRRRLSLDGLDDAGDAFMRYAGYLGALKEQERLGFVAFEKKRRVVHRARVAVATKTVEEAEAAVKRNDQAITAGQDELKKLTLESEQLKKRAETEVADEFIKAKSEWAYSLLIPVVATILVTFIVGGAFHIWLLEGHSGVGRMVRASIFGIFIGGCFAVLYKDVLRDMIVIDEAVKNAKKAWKDLYPQQREFQINTRLGQLYGQTNRTIESPVQRMQDLKDQIEAGASQKDRLKIALDAAKHALLVVKSESPDEREAVQARASIAAISEIETWFDQINDN
tara:strand:- start:20548 stop:23982 length:3435 start_codon:yes stop_codon:yes gene_type:complete